MDTTPSDVRHHYFDVCSLVVLGNIVLCNIFAFKLHYRHIIFQFFFLFKHTYPQFFDESASQSFFQIGAGFFLTVPWIYYIVMLQVTIYHWYVGNCDITQLYSPDNTIICKKS